MCLFPKINPTQSSLMVACVIRTAKYPFIVLYIPRLCWGHNMCFWYRLNFCFSGIHFPNCFLILSWQIAWLSTRSNSYLLRHKTAITTDRDLPIWVRVCEVFDRTPWKQDIASAILTSRHCNASPPTGPVWEVFTSDLWISLTKGQ